MLSYEPAIPEHRRPPNVEFFDAEQVKADGRQRDHKDVAVGRRTAQKVQRANSSSVIGDLKGAKITNAVDAGVKAST